MSDVLETMGLFERSRTETTERSGGRERGRNRRKLGERGRSRRKLGARKIVLKCGNGTTEGEGNAGEVSSCRKLCPENA